MNAVGQENMRSGIGQELSERGKPRKAETSEILGEFRYIESEILGEFRYIEPEILGEFRYVKNFILASILPYPAVLCVFSD